jgi:imidazole glycerol phosphate synthase subunit HisF
MIGEVIRHSLKRDGTITQYDIRFGKKVLRGIPVALVEAKQVQEHEHEAHEKR